MKKINVAIDGPSGVGKSTISKYISTHLGYTFINSGSIYRALGYYLIANKIDFNIEDNVVNILDKVNIILDGDFVKLNDEDISLIVRKSEVAKVASAIAKFAKVRQYVIKFVHNMIENKKGFVMDGRDTTFRLMPNAEVKIFLWAAAEDRAARRLLQNHEMGFLTSTYEEVYQDVLKRDDNDMNRKVDPLHQTEDAIYIDCSMLNEQETIDEVVAIIRKKENEAQ